jgi:hypothetical protein
MFYLIQYLFGAGHLAYLCSQWAPIVQMKYFMFDWSIYSPFVLNTGMKLHSLQMMIFLHVCSTLSAVEHKTRFDTWIANNEENGVY